ncbi:hypothetical protein ACH5RR_018359 [Cinchona calisaya]|uniref:Uncharacterized protein n=1 Tax=Cinchona calisaya TaxID=153742 RepID=A0ABD2ZPC3_9GENT
MYQFRPVPPTPPGLQQHFPPHPQSQPQQTQLSSLEETLKAFMQTSNQILQANSQAIVRPGNQVDNEVIEPQRREPRVTSQVEKEIGPFLVHTVYSHGTFDIENLKNGDVFRVNGQCLKLFLELKNLEVDIMPLEDPVYRN